MIDRLDITDEYSVNCDFILNTVIFIDAALNISLRKIWKCNVLSFYLFDQGVPNETKGTINLKTLSCHSNHSSYSIGTKNTIIRSPAYRCYMYLWNTVRIGFTASKKKPFENVDGRTDGLTTDVYLCYMYEGWSKSSFLFLIQRKVRILSKFCDVHIEITCISSNWMLFEKQLWRHSLWHVTSRDIHKGVIVVNCFSRVASVKFEICFRSKKHSIPIRNAHLTLIATDPNTL